LLCSILYKIISVISQHEVTPPTEYNVSMDSSLCSPPTTDALHTSLLPGPDLGGCSRLHSEADNSPLMSSSTALHISPASSPRHNRSFSLDHLNTSQRTNNEGVLRGGVFVPSSSPPPSGTSTTAIHSRRLRSGHLATDTNKVYV